MICTVMSYIAIASYVRMSDQASDQAHSLTSSITMTMQSNAMDTLWSIIIKDHEFLWPIQSGNFNKEKNVCLLIKTLES